MRKVAMWVISRLSGASRVARIAAEQAPEALSSAVDEPQEKRRRYMITGAAALAGGVAGLYTSKAEAGHNGGDTFHLNHNNTSKSSTTLVRNSGGTPNTFTMTLFNQDSNGSALRAEGCQSGKGVDAVCTQGNKASIAVKGEALNGGTGVYGVAGDTEVVQGRLLRTSIGVRGQGRYAGVVGLSERNGVEGTSDKEVGVYGHSFSGPGIVGSSSEGDAGRFYGDVHVSGELYVQGNKSGVVPFPDGSKRRLYCQESPEAWFEDFGEARLERGRARVNLEQGFRSVISGDYHVFLTPPGDCGGLYVRSRQAGRFDVRELNGGRTSVDFSYRIVARRKDQPADRFARVDSPRAPDRPSREAVRPGGLSPVQ